MGHPRIVGIVRSLHVASFDVVKQVEIGDGGDAIGFVKAAVVVGTRHRGFGVVHLGIHVGTAGNDFHDFQAIIQHIAIFTSFDHRCHQGPRRVGILIDPGLHGAQHLFGVPLPHVAIHGGGEAHIVEYCPLVPRFPNTIAIHRPRLHVFHHLRRRNHNQFHVLLGIDAHRRHPVAGVVVVHRGGEHHREGGRLCLPGDVFPVRRAKFIEVGVFGEGTDSGIPGFFGQGHGVAVAIKHHERSHRRFVGPQFGQHRHSTQGMGSIQTPLHQAIAHRGPTGFLADRYIQPVLLKKALFLGNHQRGTVGEGNDPNGQIRFFEGAKINRFPTRRRRWGLSLGLGSSFGSGLIAPTTRASGDRESGGGQAGIFQKFAAIESHK